MLKLCIIQIIVTLGIPFEAGSQRRRVISLFSGVLGLELGVSESGAQIIHIILAQFTFEQCICQFFQNNVLPEALHSYCLCGSLMQWCGALII